MSIAPLPISPSRVVLHDISWQTYEALVEELGDQNLRLTYDRGDLEIMSPSRLHESRKCRLGRLVETLAEEFGLAIEPGGSMTFKRADLLRGVEPDQCFWIAHESVMRGREEFDIERDPPPDLVLEIDVTSHSFARLPIYAQLRIPEVWREDGGILSVHFLGPQGEYLVRTDSPTFPGISLARLTDFLEPDPALDYLSVIREFRQWVRETRQGN